MEAGYLAKILSDLGPDSCDRNMFLDIIQQTGPMLAQGGGMEQQAAAALLMMSTYHAEGSTQWNTTLFGGAVLECVSHLYIYILLNG